MDGHAGISAMQGSEVFICRGGERASMVQKYWFFIYGDTP